MRSLPETTHKSTSSTPRNSRHNEARPSSALFSHVSHNGASRGNHSTLLITLASIFGLLAWLALTVLTTGGVALPGVSIVSEAFAQWRAHSVYGSGQPYTNGYANQGWLQGVTPLQCDSSGANAFGSDVIIPATEVVCGDIRVLGGNVTDQGVVRGSIQVVGGAVVVSGVVTGDITVIGGNISVLSGGRVDGVTRAIGGSVSISPGAIANNAGVDLQQPRDLAQPPGLKISIDVGSFWLSLLFWISAALGISALAPEMIGRVRYTITHHLALSGVIGALLALAAGIISVALIFTCLGIPLAIVIIVAAWFAWVVGTVGVGAWLGSALLGGLRSSHAPSLIASAVFGVLILSLLKALPVVGPIVGLFTGAIALGGATLTLLSARRASYTRSL